MSIAGELDKEVFYFLHIPKTAGTSLTAILDRYFAVDEILPAQLWWDVGDIAATKKRNYRFLRGHFGAGAQMLSSQKLKILTMLRDPVSLAHSTYQYIKREQNTKLHSWVVENKVSFLDFIKTPNCQNLISNRLIKSLTLACDEKSYVSEGFVNENNYIEYRKQWNQYRKSLSPDQLLDEAKSILDQLSWVGITDNFELSLLLLSYQLACPPAGHTEKLNVHNNKSEINKEAVDIIESLNSLDISLFNYGKNLFEQKKSQFYKQLGISDTSNLELITKKVDDHYQLNYLKRYNLKLLEQLDYQFSMVMLGRNWHQREWHSGYSNYFRWTGPGHETTIDFWLIPANYQVELHIIDVINPEKIEDLTIKVNDHTIQYRMIEQAGRMIIDFKSYKEYMNESGLFRLKLIFSHMEVHNKKYESGDFRKVGIALNRISIVEMANQ